MEYAPPRPEGDFVSTRIFVNLVGGSAAHRAAICHAASAEVMHIEPVCAAGELGLRELTRADVLLAWDDGDTIEQLKVQLAIAARWAPIVVIGEMPANSQVVRAMKAGATDYVAWDGNIGPVYQAVTAAAVVRSRLLPKKHWQMNVRRLLRSLSPREREVLNAVVDGQSNKGISKSLGISARTVEIHRASMMRKLGVSNTASAVRIALEGAATSEWIYGENWLSANVGDTVTGRNDNG